ncbi:hypothetical protein H072_10622 [Dactylellina haptotyla CBS 200.50]|uniref:Peptidase S8/S53 domain-containing protein n=1 Tax=Dactylellina haptotyla (strain CBS 200.50) TaxID=1284197 RepID=S7ZYV7_DACHA|nr:hypothetical protein H072_10622 [Dactylellina haptotyla CBS 200.50]
MSLEVPPAANLENLKNIPKDCLSGIEFHNKIFSDLYSVSEREQSFFATWLQDSDDGDHYDEEMDAESDWSDYSDMDINSDPVGPVKRQVKTEQQRRGTRRRGRHGATKSILQPLSKRRNRSIGYSNSTLVASRAKRAQKREVEAISIGGHAFDLQVLSQPPGVPHAGLFGKFWNFKKPGKNTVIYVIDTGYDLQHPELEGTDVQEWLDPEVFPWDEDNDMQEQYTHGDLHGTAVLSKLAGKTVGVSKNAKFVLARFCDGRGRPGIDNTMDMIIKVIDHIKTHNSRSNCVVNFSLTWNADGSTSQEYAVHLHAHSRELFRTLASLPNVIMVASAGNDPSSEDAPVVERYPAIFTRTRNIARKLIVAGGYDPYTGQEYHKTLPVTKVWAPSRLNSCACLYKDGVLQAKSEDAVWDSMPFAIKNELCYMSGTSFAVPLVAGFLANWLSNGMTINGVVDYMYKLAYPRVKDGPPVLFSGIGIESWPRNRQPDWFKQGQEPPPPPDSLPGL